MSNIITILLRSNQVFLGLTFLFFFIITARKIKSIRIFLPSLRQFCAKLYFISVIEFFKYLLFASSCNFSINLSSCNRGMSQDLLY